MKIKNTFGVVGHHTATTCLVLIIFLMKFSAAQAQPTRDQRIEDSVLGWWSIQDINNVPKAHESHGHTFTVKTQMDMKNVIEWVKKSYTPVGGLGSFKRKFYVNDYSNPPHSYGIDFRVWDVSFLPMYLDEKGHFKPVDEEYTRFGIDVNTVVGNNSIDYMSTPARYVFTWQPDGISGGAMDKVDQSADPRKHPNVQKFFTRISDDAFTVYVCPGNKLPIKAVTKGEYLQMAEDGIDRKLAQEKDDAIKKWPGNIQAQNEAFDYIKKDLERYRVDIRKWKEKYRDSLSAFAIVRDMQPNIRSFNLDPFMLDAEAAKMKQYYPIYKMDSITLAKCREDKPLWIAVWFPIERKENGNQKYELYRSMLEHFNYDYLYNYYYDPAKIKGQTYHAVNEAVLNARLDGYRKKSYAPISSSTDQAKAIKSYFQDNFSANQPGSKPAGWFFSSTGNHSLVTEIKDRRGKWIQLGYNNELIPTSLKTPLPKNFTLSFDLVSSDFDGRYGGSAVLYLDSYAPGENKSKASSAASLKIEIGSGNEGDFTNNNYRGYLNIDLNKVPEVNEVNFVKGAFYKQEQREFTNKRNLVHVVLTINNAQISISVNGIKIDGGKDLKLQDGKACKDCSIPSNVTFRKLSWKNTTNDADHVNVFLGNVQVTSD
jgi:hypothetical protein